MNDLIPTPIIDKNGKRTTVHKRSASKSNKSLGRVSAITTKSDNQFQEELKRLSDAISSLNPDIVTLELQTIEDRVEVVSIHTVYGEELDPSDVKNGEMALEIFDELAAWCHKDFIRLGINHLDI